MLIFEGVFTLRPGSLSLIHLRRRSVSLNNRSKKIQTLLSLTRGWQTLMSIWHFLGGCPGILRIDLPSKP